MVSYGHRCGIIVLPCGIAVKRFFGHWWGMSREDQHFRLRLPADLREQIEAAAAESRRSLTAEILARLQASFDAPLIKGDQTLKVSQLLTQLLDADQRRRAEAAAAEEVMGRMVKTMVEMEKDLTELRKKVG